MQLRASWRSSIFLPLQGRFASWEIASPVKLKLARTAPFVDRAASTGKAGSRMEAGS
jgi:hypothetical protein